MPAARPSVTPATPAASPRGCSNFKLRQADRVVSRHYDRHLAEVGLKTSQYSLLGHIATLGPIKPAALAAAMALDASTLTRNLQPLVAQGWVAVQAGDDARSRSVQLTDAGRAKHTEAKRAWKKAQLAFNARLGEARVADLHALLDDCLSLLGDGDNPGR